MPFFEVTSLWEFQILTNSELSRVFDQLENGSIFPVWKVKNVMTTISKLKKKFSVNKNFFREKGEKMIFKSLLLRAIFSKQTSLKVCSLELSLENFRLFKVKKEAMVFC